jgi:Zn-dependent protease
LYLFEPAQTPYDLRFRLFGIDVRVHPMFWLVSALMGWNLRDQGFSYVLLWIGCVFISILIHELGHVGVGLMFGSHGHIVLYGFGGLAIGSSNLRNRWHRIAVYFGGPLAGFLYLGVLFLILLVSLPNQALAFQQDLLYLLRIEHHPSLQTPTLMTEALWFLLQINLFWGLVNLLPVYPLDGGQISRDLFNWFMQGRGIRPSLGLSLFVAGFIAINALLAAADRPLPGIGQYLPGGMYIGILFGLLALGNYQEMQQTRPPSDYRRASDPPPWERDADYWKN